MPTLNKVNYPGSCVLEINMTRVCNFLSLLLLAVVLVKASDSSNPFANLTEDEFNVDPDHIDHGFPRQRGRHGDRHQHQQGSAERQGLRPEAGGHPGERQNTIRPKTQSYADYYMDLGYDSDSD